MSDSEMEDISKKLRWVSVANLVLIATILGTIVMGVSPETHQAFCRGFYIGMTEAP